MRVGTGINVRANETAYKYTPAATWTSLMKATAVPGKMNHNTCPIVRRTNGLQ